LDTATLPHFQQALGSYRQRGYKIGIHLSEPRDLDLLQQLGLTPDIIFADYPALTQVLITDPLPAAFASSLQVLIAKKPGIDAKTSSVLDGYLFHSDETVALPQIAIS
jgi:hypothetical protein